MGIEYKGIKIKILYINPKMLGMLLNMGRLWWLGGVLGLGLGGFRLGLVGLVGMVDCCLNGGVRVLWLI